jgi:hypothetical protein
MIAKWLLSLKYELTIVYKPGRTHVVAKVLSKLPNSSKPLGVPDYSVDASLFSIEHVWIHEVKRYIETSQMPKNLNLAQKHKLAKKA